MPARVESLQSPAPSSGASIGFSNGSFLDQLYGTMKDLKETGDKILKVTVNQPLTRVRDALTDAEVEQHKALKKAIETQGFFDMWSHSSYITSFCYAAASIVGGACLMYFGNPAGQPFVASGVAFLVQLVMSHQDRWGNVARLFSFGNPTLEQGLHTILPLAAFLVPYIFSGINIAQFPAGGDMKLQFILSLFSAVTLVTKVGEVWTKYKKGVAERELVAAESNVHVLELQVNRILPRRNVVSDTNKRIDSQAKRIIKSRINMSADFAHN
jgi:hypothetical protein